MAHAPSLDASLGARGLARGFGRLALYWPATSAGAPPERPRWGLAAAGVPVIASDRSDDDDVEDCQHNMPTVGSMAIS